jgi:Zonular occludens toxin (Zot)
LKVGGGLNYVTGPMGAGKSLYGVRRLVDSLISGRYCVTNIELVPDAPERIARHYSFLSARKRRAVADKVRRYYVLETDLSEAIRYRLPGKGEARGVFVWDEGHNDLNNRSWRERRELFKNERTGGDVLLEWATQLRKLGFVGFLLSQHMDNTEAALRRVCNFSVRLQNQREQIRLLGVRATPWPLFLAYWYPANTGEVGVRVPPVKVERYFLGWHRRLYDTFGLFHGLDTDAEEALGLHRLPEGGRPLAQPGSPRSEDSRPPSGLGASSSDRGLPREGSIPSEPAPRGGASAARSAAQPGRSGHYGLPQR